MNETAQNLAFTFEALLAAPSHQCEVEELHRYLPLKSAVVSFREPDATHSALADLRYQCVGTKNLTGQARRTRQFDGMLFEEAVLRQGTVFAEEHIQLVDQDWILGV